MADRVSSYFVPTTFAFALLILIIWVLSGLKVQHDSSQGTTEALAYAITVILVSCLCVIGLAVTVFIAVAGSFAARYGCIFMIASVIEIARKTSHVVFDKTGNLTLGQLTVAVQLYFESELPTAAAVYALISNVRHPVSLAVKKYLESKINAEALVDVRIPPGFAGLGKLISVLQIGVIAMQLR